MAKKMIATPSKTSTGRKFALYICCAMRIISTTVMTETKGVLFMTSVNSFTSGGIIRLNIWGRMICNQITIGLNPSDRAASNWPLGIEARPPRIISVVNAALESDKATIPAASGESSKPISGNT